MHDFGKFALGTLPVFAVASSAAAVLIHSPPPASLGEAAAIKTGWEDRGQGAYFHLCSLHNEGNAETEGRCDVCEQELESLRMSLLQGPLRLARRNTGDVRDTSGLSKLSAIDTSNGLLLEAKVASGGKDVVQGLLEADASHTAGKGDAAHANWPSASTAEIGHENPRGTSEIGRPRELKSSGAKGDGAFADPASSSSKDGEKRNQFRPKVAHGVLVGERAGQVKDISRHVLDNPTSVLTKVAPAVTPAKRIQYELHDDGRVVPVPKASTASGISRFLALISDPSRGVVENVPIVFVYMMASMVMMILIIRLSSWSFEGVIKNVADFRPTSARPWSGMLQYRSFPEQSLRPSSYPIARGSLQSASPTSMGTPTTRSLFTSESVPVCSPRASGGEDTTDVICPALILPQGEAQFTIFAESMRRLRIGQYPVEVLGPSGRQLLHARLPAHPAGGNFDSSYRTGRWLELTSTAKSKHPHACVGPLPLALAAFRTHLEIHGPRGNVYGTFERSGTGWSARRANRVILMIEPVEDGFFRAVAPDRGVVATESTNAEHALIVQVNSGVDALLALLCLLACSLMNPGAS